MLETQDTHGWECSSLEYRVVSMYISYLGLFCAFGLSALNWILTKSLQSGEAKLLCTPFDLLEKHFFKIYF